MTYFAKTAQLFLLPLVLFSTNSQANHSDAYGRVNMKGQIYDSACAIDTGSLDQTVSLGNSPTSDLLKNGVGPSKFFTIDLIDCDFGKKSKVMKGDLTITFTGPSDGDVFSVSGQAKGVAIKLQDKEQIILTPGKANRLSAMSVDNANDLVSLIYRVELVKVGAHLEPGDYHTVLNFILDYN